MTEPQRTSGMRAMSEPDEMLQPATDADASRPGRWIVWAVVLIGAVLLVGYATLIPTQPTDESSAIADFPGKGCAMEGLVLEPLVAATQPLVSADLPGKVVLLNLWGPWCMYCHMELPHLAAIYQQHRQNPDFQFVSVSCSPPGQQENPDQLRTETQASLDRGGYNFPVYWDPQVRTRLALLASAGVPDGTFGYPTTVVLDRDGRFQGLWAGYAAGMEKEMSALLDKLLHQKP